MLCEVKNRIMIDREIIHKLAHLARLELTPVEEEKFTTQLGSILDYVQQLSELDVDNITPTTRVFNISNVTRPDVLQTYTEREAILQNAPEQEGDFFKVPKIMNSEK